LVERVTENGNSKGKRSGRLWMVSVRKEEFGWE
jgi:hypothetical protein